MSLTYNFIECCQKDRHQLMPGWQRLQLTRTSHHHLRFVVQPADRTSPRNLDSSAGCHLEHQVIVLRQANQKAIVASDLRNCWLRRTSCLALERLGRHHLQRDHHQLQPEPRRAHLPASRALGLQFMVRQCLQTALAAAINVVATIEKKEKSSFFPLLLNYRKYN